MVFIRVYYIPSFFLFSFWPIKVVIIARENQTEYFILNFLLGGLERSMDSIGPLVYIVFFFFFGWLGQ